MNIQNTLISFEDSIHNLLLVFHDAIILNNQFEIVGIGSEVEKDLGFNSEELVGLPLYHINRNLEDLVLKQIGNGFFNEVRLNLKTKAGIEFPVGVSGFYTGFISDVNGFIVLRFKSFLEVTNANQQLQLKSLELDEFIYQASHSLRGPVATIRGLINIGSKDYESNDGKYIFNELKRFSDELDQKLYKLIFLAETGRNTSEDVKPINFIDLEQRLRAMLSEWHFFQPISLEFINHVEHPIYEEGALMESLLGQIFLFISSFEANGEREFKIITSQIDNSVVIQLEVRGFVLPAASLSLLTGDEGYAGLLTKPEWLNLYAARKILKRLKGKIDIQVKNSSLITISLNIPLLNH